MNRNLPVVVAILLLSSLFIFGCTETTTGVPFTGSQFFSRLTDLNYQKFLAGDYNGKVAYFDWNRLIAVDANLGGGGGGTTDHSTLTNLGWFSSGHFMDSDLDMNGYSINGINQLNGGGYTLDFGSGVWSGTSTYASNSSFASNSGMLGGQLPAFYYEASNPDDFWKSDGTGTATGNWNIANFDLNQKTSSYFDANWIGGRVYYVPIGADINAYATNASAGDTLILASGTYTITNDIIITKALTIVGQGVDRTIVDYNLSTGTHGVFVGRASNITIKDLKITSRGTTGASNYLAGVLFYGDANAVRLNDNVLNVDINVLTTSKRTVGIYYIDAGGTVRDSTIWSLCSTLRASEGIQLEMTNNSDKNLFVNVYNTTTTTTGSSPSNVSTPYYVLDSSITTGDIIVRLSVYNSSGITRDGSALYRIAFVTNGAKAYAVGVNSYFDGAFADVGQFSTTGYVYLYNSVLANGTTFGYVSYFGATATNYQVVGQDLNFGGYIYARTRKGLDKNMTILKDVDLVGLTKTYCDMNFISGILVGSTC